MFVKILDSQKILTRTNTIVYKANFLEKDKMVDIIPVAIYISFTKDDNNYFLSKLESVRSKYIENDCFDRCITYNLNRDIFFKKESLYG